LRLRKKNIIMPSMTRNTSVQPTPIPAAAPAERPPLDLGSVGDVVGCGEDIVMPDGLDGEVVNESSEAL
jgi:hypothetical protein